MIQISDEERIAIKQCIQLAKIHGYGNLISHLRTAWAEEYYNQGLPIEGAHGGGVMPFGMRHDIIREGCWDETGDKYRDDPVCLWLKRRTDEEPDKFVDGADPWGE
jgi:hypothetical protein